MENDMKNMHGHYKEMLLDLDKCYAGIEKDIHKKYKDFIEKWKSQMDRKCMSLKTAYEEEHKLREELRVWAEANVIELQNKVKELSEDKKKALEQVDTVIASGGKETDQLKKSLEQEHLNQKKKLDAEIQALLIKSKQSSHEIARLVVELIVQKAEEHIVKVNAVPVPVPAPAAVVVEKKSVDVKKKKKKELKSMVKKLNKDNENLRKAVKDLEQANKRLEEISEINSKNTGAVVSVPVPVDLDNKDNSELTALVKELQEELSKANKKNEALTEMNLKASSVPVVVAHADRQEIPSGPSPETKRLQEALVNANKKIEELTELNLKLTAVPEAVAVPVPVDLNEEDASATIKQLQEELLKANKKIEVLSEMNLKASAAPVVPVSVSGKEESSELAAENKELQEELLKARKKIEELSEGGLKSSEASVVPAPVLVAAGSNNDEANAKIKELQEELAKRPKPEEVTKLNEIVRKQEKQLKDLSSSQGEQVNKLNEQIKELKSSYEAKIKELEAKSAQSIKEIESRTAQSNKELNDQITKLSKNCEDVNQIREKLEKQLKFELEAKEKMSVELEKVSKVAGEAVVLTKKVEELNVSVVALTEKNQLKEQELKDSLRQRKLLHNQLEDLKGKIRVFCRVRPLSKGEKDRGSVNITTTVDEFTLTLDTKNGIKPFVYDSVFGPNSTQEEVFEDTKRVVQSAVDGYNVCVFAYGQTGSGKTYTMQGFSNNPGVTPRAMEELFNVLGHLPNHYRWEVKCYMVELYLDNLVDLFLPKEHKGAPPQLTIKKDSSGIVRIPEAYLHTVKSAKEILDKYEDGNSMRHTSSTKMNDTSSRSHLVFSVIIDVTNGETGQRTVGKLSLVDLAGSERVSKTEATAERLKEGRAINKSLSALGDVISALSSNETHIPYRNNKLTMLMSDSLGGTAKTLMFVNISPASFNLEETTMSLYYAARVKLITNDPTKNIESKELSALKQEILMVSGERDRYKAALEKQGYDINNLEIIQEKNEDFDDPKYDDL